MTRWTYRFFSLVAACGVAMSLAGAARAQLDSQPPTKEPRGDTLTMSCEHARSLVHGRGGTVLYSGPNRYDLYHATGNYCFRLQQVKQAAYVPTRDNPQCFIGFICMQPEYDQHIR
jgi:hypothetical protein